MAEDFPDGGETGALIRSLDWSQTPLGPRAAWPMSLKALVRTMLHAKQPMILWWGPQLVQLYNDAMLVSMHEKHPGDMGRPARESWRDAWPTVGAQLEAVVERGAAIWQEEMCVPVTRNGRIEDAWWTYNYSPVFDDGSARAGILITCTETTAGVVARKQLVHARHEAERARSELQQAFMQSPIPVAIVTGADYVFTFANRRYEELVGRSVLGRALFDVFSEEEVGYYRPLLDRSFVGGESHTVQAVPLKLVHGTAAGRQLYIDVTYQPYRDADGKTIGVVAQIIDVTAVVEEREAAARLELETARSIAREQEMRHQAEAYGRSRDNFLAMLSHELRNPIASIATAVEVMNARGETASTTRERHVIQRQVRHLTHLVDDLLDTARITRGKLELRRTDIDLDTVVRNALEQVGSLLQDRHHELAYATPPTPVYVHGDVVRLAQVVANLVANSARYTPRGGKIEVIARRDGDHAVVVVRDNGPGFAPELLPAAFELFVQGERRAGREEGGLGLGLALVKQLVVMHGGTVEAANLPARGSEVVVRIPAIATPAPAPVERPRASVPPVARRILVVDDNADAGMLLGEILRIHGHEVVVAQDAQQALAQLAGFAAEVGIFDIGLPDVDGYELARRVRALPGGRDLRLAAVTGYGAPADRERTAAAGFDTHLTKPVAIAALLEFVAR